MTKIFSVRRKLKRTPYTLRKLRLSNQVIRKIKELKNNCNLSILAHWRSQGPLAP